MSGANVSPIGRNKEEWLVQATGYWKLNEPPRPRLQRNGTIYLMARRPLLCQGGDFAFPAGCPRRPCPADDLWVMISWQRFLNGRTHPPPQGGECYAQLWQREVFMDVARPKSVIRNKKIKRLIYVALFFIAASVVTLGLS